MSFGLPVDRARSSRWSSIIPALVMAGILVGACFDSDEKPLPLDLTTTTTGPDPTTSTGPDPTTGTSTSTGEPEVTCRDAIDCVIGCAGELQQSKLPEPDLTCFLECEEGLTVGEALDLFRLTECVTNKCIDQGVCDILVPTETTTTTGDESSSSGGSSGSSTGGEPPGPANPCLDCILANMLDENPGGECQGLADMCI